MEKSYVTMEQKLCVVCDKAFDSGALLLDKRLRQRFDRHTTTGYGVCKSHLKPGYVLLIEADPEKSQPQPDGTMTPAGAFKTGTICHLKERAFKEVFNVPVPKGGFCYVEPDVVRRLRG